MPLDAGDRDAMPALLNLSDLLPTDQRYYQFMGSPDHAAVQRKRCCGWCRKPRSLYPRPSTSCSASSTPTTPARCSAAA